MRRLLSIALFSSLAACRATEDPPPFVSESALHVPHVAHMAEAEITIDGELDEPAWLESVRVGPFTKDGVEARPFSDARFLWDDRYLYFTLYAADQDLRATQTEHDAPLWMEDAFALTFGPRRDALYLLEISPIGTTTDVRIQALGLHDGSWESGAEVAIDTDGTLNDPNDEDEEWVVEGRVPLRALGLGPGMTLGMSVTRCDTPKGSKRTCGGWGDGPGRAPAGAIELVRGPVTVEPPSVERAPSAPHAKTDAD